MIIKEVHDYEWHDTWLRFVRTIVLCMHSYSIVPDGNLWITTRRGNNQQAPFDASKIFVWLARGMSCVPLCNWYLTFCYVRFLSSSMQMCRFPSNSIQFWPYTAQSSQHSPNQTRKIVFSWLARLLPRARPILATLLMLSFFPISSLGSMHSSFRCRFSSSLCI